MKRSYITSVVFLFIFCVFNSAYAGIAIDEPMTRAVYQRGNDDTAIIPVEGTITGITFTSIEARYVLASDPGVYGDWEVMDVAGSDYTGLLEVPAGGWYTMEARALNGVTTTGSTSVEKIGVGEVFITAGQSNSTNCGNFPARMTPTYDTVSAWTGTAWRHAYDPQPICYGAADICSTDPAYGASPWSRLGDMLAEDLGVPIGFISVGYGGTYIAQWLPVGGTLYPRIQGAITDAGEKYGVRAIIWHQGESDGLYSTTIESYANSLTQIITKSDTRRSAAGYR